MAAQLRQIVSARFLEHAEREGLEPGEYDQLIDQVAGAVIDPYTAADEIVGVALATSQKKSRRV